MEMTIRRFAPGDEKAVVELWRQCELIVPWNDPHRDIERKLRQQPDLFLVGEIDGSLIATVMAGYEGHRGWINYLAVSPTLRRHGLGQHMMEAAEEALREIGAPKINLQVREGNHDVVAFYEAIGYAVEPIINMGKRLVSDE